MVTMVKYCVIFFTLFIFVNTQIPQTCRKLSACVCIDEHNRIVNLTALSSTVSPRFKDHPTAGGDDNKYSWNPCHNFDEGPADGGCINVGACKVSPSGQYTGIGSTDTVEFSHDDNGNLSLVMTQTHGNQKIETHVILYCDQSKEAYFRVIGEVTSNIYWLQLWSKYNCPRRITEEGEVTMTGHMTTVPDPGHMTMVPDPGHMTMPDPGVMTSATPGDSKRLKSIEIILFCTLILVALILVVLLTKYSIRISHGKNIMVRYSKLPTQDTDILI